MATPLLSTLVQPSTPDDVLTIQLGLAQTLGLATTSWQPLDPSRTIFQVNANVVSQYSSTVALLAQGAYASYAALMVDSNGTPITTWMDLRSQDQYNVVRVPASGAAGNVPYTNSGGQTYPYTPNAPLHFQHPVTGATYTSSGSGSVAPGTGTVTVTADAAYFGSAGNAAVGVTLLLTTPLAGVTINSLTQSLIGTPLETNAALLQRCQAKLATLSALTLVAQGTTPVPAAPGGAPGAYEFVAKSIPVAASASSVWPYAVTAAITRVLVTTIGSGIVDVYLANAAGVPPSGDIAAVNAAIQALCVPQAVTAIVQSASSQTINVTYTAYVRSASGLTSATAAQNILNALTNYFETVPIGGDSTTAANIMPLSGIIDTIFDANPGTVDVSVTLPTGNVHMGPTSVPVLGTVTGTVVLT